MGFALVYSEELLLYDFSLHHPYHPMKANRVKLAAEQIVAKKLADAVLPARMASVEEVELFHTKEYVEYVKDRCAEGVGYLDYGDTPAFPGCFEAALYTVGSTLEALEYALSNNAHAINLSGGFHHAARSRAAGFCIFNDAGVAIERALKAVERLLYVDIDAHHGDGVFYAFEDDPRVWIVDVHESGDTLYPGTGFEWERGKGRGEGTKLNIPLKAWSGDEVLGEVVGKLAEHARKAEPELIILQMGADCIDGDPITHLKISLEGHRRLVSAVHDLAHELCDGKLVALGGGGYNVRNTVAAWVNAAEVLSG